MNKNPFIVTYTDLIAYIEGKVKWMELNHDRMKMEGSISAWKATKNMQCAKKLLMMLMMQEKNRQLSLGDIFEKTRP